MIIQYNTGKTDIVLVKFPEDKSQFYIEMGHIFTGSSSNTSWDLHGRIELPPGNWQIVGNPFELSEIESRELVPALPVINRWINFETNHYCMITAVQSMKGLLNHLNVYQVNPYKDQLIDLTKEIGSEEYHWFREKWLAAEERTGNWQLLTAVKA